MSLHSDMHSPRADPRDLLRALYDTAVAAA